MKRIFDIFILFLFLPLWLFLLIILILLVYIKLGSPIFFIQTRVGKDNKLFKLFKFRTMINYNNNLSNYPLDKDRLTNFSKYLRSTSLDELPELWNILKGDMSFVGPRPLLKEYIPLYNKKQIQRHNVKPGITGWAQINGRNLISWEEKFVLDVWYVENYSFWLDIKILWRTIIKVMKREGISAEGNVTMPKFKGSKE